MTENATTREVQVLCSECHHEQWADRGARGASVRCQACSHEVLVPGIDQCLECGESVPSGQDACASCQAEARQAKSIKGRAKSVGAGIITAAIGAWIGYGGVWRALETGTQTFHYGSRSSHNSDPITRGTDPIEFWVSTGFSALFSAGLILFAVLMLVTGALGKGSAGITPGDPGGASRRNRRRWPRLRLGNNR